MKPELPRGLLDEAEKRGYEAYLAGKKNVAVWDAELCKLSYWSDERVMAAWSNGWTKARTLTGAGFVERAYGIKPEDQTDDGAYTDPEANK